VASPKSRPWWILWVHVCPWLIRAPKRFQLCINQLLFGLCRFEGIIELLVILPSPTTELQHAPLSPKCYERGAHPNSFSFYYLHPWAHSWVQQGVWGCVNHHYIKFKCVVNNKHHYIKPFVLLFSLSLLFVCYKRCWKALCQALN